MSLGASFPGGNNTPGHGRAWARARRSGLGLTPHPQFPKPYVAALGAVGSASLPTAQIPLLDVMLGQEEEVAGQAWWWVLGLRRGSSRGWWGRRQRSVPLPTPREGCGGPWVGIVLVKVGQVPALCSAGAGASLCVWGGSVGKGQCSSTSSISSSPTVLPGGQWCTLAAHLGPALGYVLFEDASCQGRGDRALLSRSHIGCGEGWSEHISLWAAKDLTGRDQGLAERFRKHWERPFSC